MPQVDSLHPASLPSPGGMSVSILLLCWSLPSLFEGRSSEFQVCWLLPGFLPHRELHFLSGFFSPHFALPGHLRASYPPPELGQCSGLGPPVSLIEMPLPLRPLSMPLTLPSVSSSTLRDAGFVMINLRIPVTGILLHCQDFNSFKPKDGFVGLCTRRPGRTRERAGALSTRMSIRCRCPLAAVRLCVLGPWAPGPGPTPCRAPGCLDYVAKRPLLQVQVGKGSEEESVRQIRRHLECT